MMTRSFLNPLRTSLLLALLLAAACDTESTYIEPEGPRSVDNRYHPLRLGQEYVYAYDSIVYRDFEQAVDTVRGQMRMRYTDTFREAGGPLIYRIARSYRPHDSAAWTPHSTWSAWRDSTEVIMQEGATPLVKIRYPLDTGRRWDGNRYHGLGNGDAIDELRYGDAYEVVQFREEATLGDAAYDTLFTVRQVYDSTSVYTFHHYEVYARGVGMVVQYRKDSLSDQPEFPRGQIIRQRLLRYTP